jgi:hypothetical protein
MEAQMKNELDGKFRNPLSMALPKFRKSVAALSASSGKSKQEVYDAWTRYERWRATVGWTPSWDEFVGVCAVTGDIPISSKEPKPKDLPETIE